jgi:hypothetical protein
MNKNRGYRDEKKGVKSYGGRHRSCCFVSLGRKGRNKQVQRKGGKKNILKRRKKDRKQTKEGKERKEGMKESTSEKERSEIEKGKKERKERESEAKK